MLKYLHINSGVRFLSIAVLSIFFTFGIRGTLYGQISEELRFKSFGIAEGLSQNTVYDIEQSKDGMLWLATIDGLNRFDGSSFRKFVPDDTVTRSYGSVIYAIDFWDDQYLLVGMSKGLLLFDIIHGEFLLPDRLFPNLVIDSDLPLQWIDHTANSIYYRLDDDYFEYKVPSQTISKLALPTESVAIESCRLIDSNLLCYSGVEIFRREGNQFSLLRLPSKSNAPIVNIAGDDHHLFVQRSRGGIEHWYMDASNSLRAIQSKLDDSLSSSSMLLQKAEKLYIGTRDRGIYRYNINTQVLAKTNDALRLSGLKSNFILDLFEGQQGFIYAGTSGGGFSVLLNELESIQRLTPSHINEDIQDDMVLGIKQDGQGNIYMGGLFEGFKVYSPSRNTLKQYTSKTLDREAMNIYDFEILSDSKMLIASWDGLLQFDFKTNQFQKLQSDISENKKLYALCRNEHRGVFLGGEQGLHYYDFSSRRYSLQDELVPESDDLIIRHMDFLSEDQLLLATTNKSLVIYDTRSKSFQYLDHLISFCRSVRYFDIGEKNIFLATDRGLLCLNKDDYKIQATWTTDQGLSNDFVYSCLQDATEQVWLATNRGLSAVNLKDSTAINYDLIDGLQSYEFNTAAALHAQDNTLLFGGTEGLNIIESGIGQNIKILQDAVLTHVRVNAENYQTAQLHNYIDHVKVAHHQNNIFLDYASPYHWTDKLEYWYRFKGADDWNYNGKNTSINYSGLTPGKYTVELKSSIGAHQSEEYELISFEITPAWWQTWWFKTLALLGILFLTYLIVSYRAKRKQEALRIENTIIQLENRMLRYRMNPHFIFNTLNSIKYHALFKTKEETSEYISEFSQIIRGILEYNSLAFISLSDDIEWITDYLKIEQKRFKNGFEFEINVDDNLNVEHEKIPPLLLQPFIENAIWHGILHRKENRKISLDYKSLPSGFSCTLTDNGVGRQESRKLNAGKKDKKQSLGMSITDQRIENINREGNFYYRYSVNDLKDSDGIVMGTKVVLTCEQNNI